MSNTWGELWDGVRDIHSGPIRFRIAIEFEADYEVGPRPLTQVSVARLSTAMPPEEFEKIMDDIAQAFLERTKITRS